MAKNISKDVGFRIKSIRKENKMTQKELSDLVDKSLRTIQGYENGSINISMPMLEKIAIALNVNVFELLDDDSDADIYIDYLARDKTLTFMDAFESLLYFKGFMLILLKNDPKHAILQHRLHNDVKLLIDVSDFSTLLSSVADYFDYKLQNFIDDSERLTSEQYDILKKDNEIEKIVTKK